MQCVHYICNVCKSFAYDRTSFIYVEFGSFPSYIFYPVSQYDTKGRQHLFKRAVMPSVRFASKRGFVRGGRGKVAASRHVAGV